MLIFVISSLVICPSYSFTVASSVMKVQVYEKNDLTNTYQEYAYGSAIYMGNNRILTNAHVILNDKNQVVDAIELCGVVDPTKRPQCFGQAKVVWYDNALDLALLESQEPMSGNVVRLASANPKVDDVVIIKGFPSNGLDTITTTRWFVGGNYQDYLKLDADLDGGNSGWGWFNAQYELIGVPTFVVEWSENLWYIIPVEKVKNFLNKKGVITMGKKGYDKSFTDYILSKNTVLKSGIVKTNFLNIKKVVWFDIIDYKIWHNQTYNVVYQSTKSDAVIHVNVSNMTDDNWYPLFADAIIKELRAASEDIIINQSSASVAWLNWKLVQYSNDEMAVEWSSYYVLLPQHKIMQISIFWSKKESSSIIAKKLLNRISLKKSTSVPSYLGRYGFVDFQTDFWNISQDEAGVVFDPASISLSKSEYSFRKVWTILEYNKMITWLEKLAKISWNEKMFAVKNKQWHVMQAIYSPSEDDTDTYKLIFMFLAKKDGTYYLNGLSFEYYKDDVLEKKIIDYIDNLKIYDMEVTHTTGVDIGELIR